MHLFVLRLIIDIIMASFLSTVASQTYNVLETLLVDQRIGECGVIHCLNVLCNRLSSWGLG